MPMTMPMPMTETRYSPARSLAPALAALSLLSAPLAADTARDWQLGDHLRLAVVQPDGTTIVPGAFGELRISTEADGGRWLSVHVQFANSLLNGFDQRGGIESWEDTMLGYPALLLEGGQVAQRVQTLQRGRPLSGTRLVAVLDACQPGGEPVSVLMVTPSSGTAEPLADPVLGALLDAMTLHAGPDVEPCPPGLFDRFVESSGAEPRAPEPDAPPRRLLR